MLDLQSILLLWVLQACFPGRITGKQMSQHHHAEFYTRQNGRDRLCFASPIVKDHFNGDLRDLTQWEPLKILLCCNISKIINWGCLPSLFSPFFKVYLYSLVPCITVGIWKLGLSYTSWVSATFGVLASLRDQASQTSYPLVLTRNSIIDPRSFHRPEMNDLSKTDFFSCRKFQYWHLLRKKGE